MITADELRALLDYDPETGVFKWRVNTSRKIRSGDTAGTTNERGYVRVGINKRMYAAHRLAWLHVHGLWPHDQIDHINGDRGDNRIANLRIATGSQNCRNTTCHRDNRSGVKGVTFEKRRRKWKAQILVSGRHRNLGCFDRIEDAASAYRAAAREHFGEFAGVAEVS